MFFNCKGGKVIGNVIFFKGCKMLVKKINVF